MKANGASCTYLEECLGGICSGSVCKAGVGKACAATTECVDSWCDKGSGSGICSVSL